MKTAYRVVFAWVMLVFLTVAPSYAASMNDYCIVPPFIQQNILPNLLLVIDNSASMFDLSYPDRGKRTCSTTTTTSCNFDSGCPTGETCSKFTRQPFYCYDQTFSSVNEYEGYFDSSKLYKYVFANNEFEEDTNPFVCDAGGQTGKSITNHLCVVYNSTSPYTVTKYLASGKYLNWLTSSKFDVQKKILSGGKYNGTHLLAESRGCVGQSFIKEALSANFVNYDSPETNNTNSKLGITFGVRGPYDPVNRSAPSQGGQTYLDIYRGAFTRVADCQDAVLTFTNPSSSLADIKKDACACLTGDDQCKDTTGTQTAVVKTKVVFQQSMQACWACEASTTTPHTCTKTDIGIDDMNTAETQCTDIFASFATCENNPDTVCTTASGTTGASADCNGNTCLYGPGAIVPGNPGLFCSNEFLGQFYAYKGAGTANTCIYGGAACSQDSDCSPATYKQCSKTATSCNSDADCAGSGNKCNKTLTNTCSSSATAAGWFNINGSKTYSAAMYQSHRDFCGSFKALPITDPTDAPSDTSTYDNIPAILGGTGAESELGAPIATMMVRLKKASAPAGIIHDYSSKVRMGIMTFNFSGSAAESGNGIPLQYVCSTDKLKVCTSNNDCPSGGTCSAAVAGTDNKDGAYVKTLIGKGHCSVTVATPCATANHCPAGEYCVSDGIGSYSSGLVSDLNGIFANAWTPFSEAFYNAIGYYAQDTSDLRKSRTAIRLNSTDYPDSMNPSELKCQPNYVMIITDGTSTADRRTEVDNLSKLYSAAGGATGWTNTCPSYAGSVNVDNLAWIANKQNIKTFSTTTQTAAPADPAKDLNLNERIHTFVVFNGSDNGLAGECNSFTLMDQAAKNGGTGGAYKAEYPDQLRLSLNDAFAKIAGGTASGTAASILSNSEGSGATLLQALFYPLKEFDKTNTTDSKPTSLGWIGELQSFWYYLDPFLQNTSIREDTTKDYKLNLLQDKVIQFYFDPLVKKTLVNKYSDLNGDGVADSNTPDAGGAAVSPDMIGSLWKAGRLLWERNLTTAPRTIYTNFNASGTTLGKLDIASGIYNSPDFQRLAQVSHCSVTDSISCQANLDCPLSETCVFDDDKAKKLINYVHGVDQADHTDGTPYRPRKVTILGCGLSDAAGCTREWKLGDIVSSTPKIVSNIRLNNYHLPSPTGYNDLSYARFTNTTGYKTRGMAFVGANDGMLHAFKLGILNELNARYEKSKLVNPDGSTVTSASNVGQEEWAYIPVDTIPYLKYLHDPNYSHLFYVDRTPTVFDASIANTCAASDYSQCTKSADGSTWRTILLGGTGFGGAVTNSVPCNKASEVCIPTPSSGYGYSQYFALDVTDPATPKYLWQFNDPLKGFATTGPAIIRIDTGKDKNGKWYAVFANGPTGPIDTDNNAFKGESNQNLRLFVVDVATGTLAQTIDTGIANAFAGTLTSSWIDADRSNPNNPAGGYYSDDAVYVGYVEKDTATNTWNKGGVIRLLTRESSDPASADPTKAWTWSKVIDGVGPITTSVTKLQDRKNKNLWLFFGTGRFYFKNDDISTTRQAIYGIKDPCYSTRDRQERTPHLNLAGGTDNDIDQNCSDAVSGTIVDQSGESAAPTSTLAPKAPGWKINLDAKDSANSYLTERIITDPLALPNGAVFFTSFTPNSDLCKFGGDSRLWAVRYDSGGVPPASAMQGKALMQVSTGAFAEIKLSDAFKNPGSTRYDGRRLANPITGVPPTSQGLSLFANPPPVKKMLHVREK